MELLTGTRAEQPVPARVTLYVTLQPERLSGVPPRSGSDQLFSLDCCLL